MTSLPAGIDAARSLQISAEITRTCKLLRQAYLQSKREELLSVYQGYKNLSEPFPVRPDTDALLVGFQDDWSKHDLTGIVSVGDRVDPAVFADNREARAYYLTAKQRLASPPSPNPEAP